ncbi:MAG TPA: YbfB/YjiJ family MFS transporter [Rhodopseudomonas sp.]|uniref:YbfB/YjiJ family MFS transporter n=1 Tax=Rhodopseudomonas sp. TaxID=1078 RepID=UPI002EDA0531
MTVTQPWEVPRSRSGDVVTALGLSAGAAVSLGFSRFAYALLLPSMQKDMAWSYVEAGALNTANGAGYIAGALLAAWSAARWGRWRAFLVGYMVSVAILLLTACSSDIRLLFALRLIGGAATAVTFILGAALAAAICPASDASRRGTLVGIYVAGSSLGILLAGLVVPAILSEGITRWPYGWIALGSTGLLGLFPALMAARSITESSGQQLSLLRAREFLSILPTFIGYGLFGAGYVGYMTFIIALLRDQGNSQQQMMLFWLFLGLVSTVSTLLWGRVLGHFPRGLGPAAVFTTAMLGSLPLLIAPGPGTMMLSALLFGGSFMAGPTSITILTQKQLPLASWTAGISLLTVGFAFGQAVGPIATGFVSDRTGELSSGLWVSPICLGFAAIVMLFQRTAMQRATS